MSHVSKADKASVNLLYTFVGVRRRDGESLSHATARLAADLDYSPSAISRALKNGRVSDRLHTALLAQVDRESKWTKRTIYYSQRLLNNAGGKRLAELRTVAQKESGYFRGRVTKYRNRVQGEFTKRLREIERQKLELMGIEIDDDIIFETDITPSA